MRESLESYRYFSLRLFILCSAIMACASPDAGSNSLQQPTTDSGRPHDGRRDLAQSEAKARLKQALDQNEYQDFALIIGDRDGNIWTYEKGVSVSENMIIWSASKWVTSTIMLDLVDEGKMRLESRPQEFISWWGDFGFPQRREMTLQQLLAFTSGFKDEERFIARCTFRPRIDFLDCAKRIFLNNPWSGSGDDNGGVEFRPGTTYSYGGKHMHIAGLIAMEALRVPTWHDVFDRYRKKTGLFPGSESRFKDISEKNPMPSGGLHTTALEYAEFLRRHLKGDIVSASSRAKLYQDHTPEGRVRIEYSPIRDEYHKIGVSEDWHYGLGLWIECPQSNWSAECGRAPIYSSPGAKGFYPWIDFEKGYFGVLATKKYDAATTSVKLVRPVRSLVEQVVQER